MEAMKKNIGMSLFEAFVTQMEKGVTGSASPPRTRRSPLAASAVAV
jgi:hypothetical protein